MVSDIFISVIIPNYNHALFLETRIRSVLNQSYKNFEIILLDDCSKDNSKEIIGKYANHPQVSHVVYNQENSGSTFKQWNKGIHLATYDWIWFAESDDAADEHFLSKMIHSISANRDTIGISYCQSLSIDESEKVWGDCLMWTDDLSIDLWRSDFTMNGKEAIEKYLIIKNVIPNASACLINKKALIEVGMAPVNMKYCGDWYLWCQILFKYDLAYVSEPLNYFRFHTTTTRVFFDRTAFLNKLEEDCKILVLIMNHGGINQQRIVLASAKLEQDIYNYFKDNRQFPYTLRMFNALFKKYHLPVHVSIAKLYKYYVNLLWEKKG